MKKTNSPRQKAVPDVKYPPDGRYVALKVCSHPSGVMTPAAPGKSPVAFSMQHRSPDEIEYLVDVIKAIKPA